MHFPSKGCVTIWRDFETMISEQIIPKHWDTLGQGDGPNIPKRWDISGQDLGSDPITPDGDI